MIIGVTGQARHGKDTVAGYLEQKYGFVRIGLADPMKRICKEVFDFSDAQLYGDQRDAEDKRYLRKRSVVQEPPPNEKFIATIKVTEEYLTPRYALQTLGTEWGRGCYHNIWIELGIRNAKKLLKGSLKYTPWKGLEYKQTDYPAPAGVVFSDIRFKNEFDSVKAAGGLMVRVVRDSLENHQVGILGHASEEEQKTIPDSACDAVLRNDVEGDLEFLYRQVDHFMERVKSGT